MGGGVWGTRSNLSPACPAVMRVRSPQHRRASDAVSRGRERWRGLQGQESQDEGAFPVFAGGPPPASLSRVVGRQAGVIARPAGF